MNDQLNELFQKIQIEIDEKTCFLPPSALPPPSSFPLSSSSPPPSSSINPPPSSYLPPSSNSSPPTVSSYHLPSHPPHPSSYSPPPSSSLSNKKNHYPYRPSTPNQRLALTLTITPQTTRSLATLNTSESSRPSPIHAPPPTPPPPPSFPPPPSSYSQSYPPPYSHYPPSSYSPSHYPHPPLYPSPPSYPPPSFYDHSSILPHSYPPAPSCSLLPPYPSSYPPPPSSSSLNKQAIEEIVKQTTVEVLKNINPSFDHSLILEEQLNNSFKNAKISKILNNNSPPLLERPGLNVNESIFIAKKKEILNQISYLDREILNMMNNDENESVGERNSFFSMEKEEKKEIKSKRVWLGSFILFLILFFLNSFFIFIFYSLYALLYFGLI